MQPYDFLASIYDKDWGKFLHHYQPILKELEDTLGFEHKKVLDVACGTGNLVLLLKQFGATVLGLDRSQAMLEVAREKCALHEVMFLRGDMRENHFKSECFDLIFCTFDSINYLLDLAGIEATLRNIRNYLKNDGIFIFDINTKHAFGFQHIGMFKRELGGISFIQKHEFFQTACIEKTTFQFPTGIEIHEQRGYEKSQIDQTLEKVGLSILKCLNAYRKSAGDETAERLIYFVRK